jgi:hypothetical protein
MSGMLKGRKILIVEGNVASQKNDSQTQAKFETLPNPKKLVLLQILFVLKRVLCLFTFNNLNQHNFILSKNNLCK